MMPEKHEKETREDLFYFFVRFSENTKNVKNIIESKKDISPLFYVVPSKIVAKYVKDEHEYWIGLKRGKEGNRRIFRLGTNKKDYKIQTPFTEDYKNAWHLL
ncbi:MAG: hypothetical protein LBQ47_01090, partial [Endomicrobium sp.]|nr:hypothetical protein [Endomicrobium sp.]